MSTSRALLLVTALAVTIAGSACRGTEPAKRYPITGQVLAVDTANRTMTLRHEDIEGYMPGMTMTFPVAAPADLQGRSAGDLIKATLEVTATETRLVDIVHTGTAALAVNANQVAMATGLLEVGSEVPDAAFIDQSDRRRSFAEWRGTVTAVTFVYASCPLPTFCPLMDQNFATLQNAVTEDPALRGKVKLISISIDPARDTPAALAAHAARRKSDPAVWTWLTGDSATIDRFAGRFGVGILRPADTTDITHNLRTAVIDRNGRITKLYTGNGWTPSQLLDDLRAAVALP